MRRWLRYARAATQDSTTFMGTAAPSSPQRLARGPGGPGQPNRSSTEYDGIGHDGVAKRVQRGCTKTNAAGMQRGPALRAVCLGPPPQPAAAPADHRTGHSSERAGPSRPSWRSKCVCVCVRACASAGARACMSSERARRASNGPKRITAWNGPARRRGGRLSCPGGPTPVSSESELGKGAVVTVLAGSYLI